MKHVLLLFACFACCTAQGADKVRTWTDVQGRTMQAEFVREVDGDVAFLKDGKLITFPLERLSDADRKVIRELEANKVVPEEEKPAGATPAFVDPMARSEKPPSDLGTAGSKGATAENRVWTDTRGNKFMAKFVRVHEGQVVLLRGARTMTIVFDTLSAGDQAYVREVLTARGEANLIPQVAAENQSAQPAGAPAFNSPLRIVPPVMDRNEPPTHEPSHGVAEAQRGDSNRAVENPSPQTTAQNEEPAGGQAQAGGSSSGNETRFYRARRIRFKNAPDVINYIVRMPIGAAIGSLIFAFVVRAAVYWVSGEHLPYGDAYGTAFFFTISYSLIGLVFGLLTMNVPDQTVDLLTIPMAVIAFLVQSGVISIRLNATYGAACLVTLVIYLTVAAIIAIVVLLVLAVVFGIGIAVSSRY